MIIGLVGFIGAGKNTVAKHLVSKHNYTQDSFANTLKDVCSTIFSWPRDLIEGDTQEGRVWRNREDQWWSKKLKIPNFTPRLALQLIGTDALRDHFNNDIWTLSLERRISYNDRTVISDARFPNEIDFIRKQNGFIVFVDNGERPEWYDHALKANNGDQDSIEIMNTNFKHVHISEWAWIGTQFDGIILNNGTLCDLRKNTENILELLNTQ